MAERNSDDQIEADLNMNVEEFVTKFTLPHFARVKEGIYDAYTQSSLEIANGELLELYRVVYPLTVTLDFVSSTSGMKQTVSMSTMNDDLRFHVLTRNEEPFVYPTIAEVIKEWPLVVRCMTNDTNTSVSVVDGDVLPRPAFKKDEELRLVRKMWNDYKKLVLECRVQSSTERLIQLPATDVGRFLELTDLTKSFTLQELIDIAPVERRLEIDRSCKCKPMSLKGVPRDRGGTIHLSKPLVQVQVVRLQESEYNTDFTVSDPFLVPVDCEIVLSPRDETYQQKPSVYKTYALSSLVEIGSFTYPSVARVASWTEPSAFLQNHLIRPGDNLVFYNRGSVDLILAHSIDRYLLIPVTNRGKFVCTRCRSHLRLELLEKHEFPISVECFSDEDATLEGGALSLDAFIKDEPCVLACKIFGDRVGTAFRLPLRTRIRVLPVDWRGERLPKAPTRFSTYDDSMEYIPVKLYEEIMENPRSRNTSNMEGQICHNGLRVVPIPSLARGGGHVYDLDSHTMSLKTKHLTQKTVFAPTIVELVGKSVVRVRQNKKPPLPLPPPKERPKAAKPTTNNEYLTSIEATVGLSQLPHSPKPFVDVGPDSQTQRTFVCCKESVRTAARPSKDEWQPPCMTQGRTYVQKESNTSPGKATVSSAALKETVRCQPPLPSYKNNMITSGKGSQKTVDLKLPSYENQVITSGTRSKAKIDLKSQSYENCEIASATGSHNATDLKPAEDWQKKPNEDVKIPKDGNIANFTASEMSQFLRQMNVPADIIVTWHEQRITGRDFARMSDDALIQYRIDNAIIKFFRNRSRIRQTGLDCL